MKHKKINKLKFIFSLSERKLLAEGIDSRIILKTQNTYLRFESFESFIHLKCYEGR